MNAQNLFLKFCCLSCLKLIKANQTLKQTTMADSPLFLEYENFRSTIDVGISIIIYER